MQGKNIVIVGGSHGIGFGIVQRMVARGAQTTVISREIGELESLAGVNHIAKDVCSAEFDASEFPSTIDGLVYCPGSINLGPLRGVSIETMMSDFELNVLGAVKVVKAALSGLKSASSASLVLFSTVAVQTGMAMHTSVAASKGALEALARTWAAELSPSVRVNCIAPALTDTPLASRLLATDEKKAAMAKMYPLGRYGQVEDVASAAEFLLDSSSSWMTGQVLSVDGGLSSVKK